MKWVRGDRIAKGSTATVYAATVMPQTPNSPLLELAAKSALYTNSSSLQREARILERLTGNGCDHIIKSYGECLSLESGKTIYNLMLEYASKGSLFDLINGGKLPECTIRRYARMILKGLSSIHSRGIVHCDLKPENILVLEQDQLKIADFGLAMELGEEEYERIGHCCNFRGTPYYMSPESLKHRIIRPALDIWSLGCVVVEMLKGEPAWGDYLDFNDLYACLLGEKEMTSPIVPDYLSEEAKDFLNKCFDRDYKKRWTADKLLNHPFVAFRRKEMS